MLGYLSIQYSGKRSDVALTKVGLIFPPGLINLLFLLTGIGFFALFERKNHGGEVRLSCCIYVETLYR